MRYLALATDFDGTLAERGEVAPRALSALAAARAGGMKLVLVTGRELDDLIDRFDKVEAFDAIVAENGAVLYTPSPPRERALARPPPLGFAAALRARGVMPLSCGRIIVATSWPNEAVVREVIREQALDLEVIPNKGSRMVLPAGVDKASGLRAALAELDLLAEDVVAVGDAENDRALLAAAGLGVAVANAVPPLKEEADVVMLAPEGEGVVALVEALLSGAFDELGDARDVAPPRSGRRPSASL